MVLDATNDRCMSMKPKTLKANAKFKTENGNYKSVKIQMIPKFIKKRVRNLTYKNLPKVIKLAATVPRVPDISSSVKNAIKYLNNDNVTRVVSRNV